MADESKPAARPSAAKESKKSDKVAGTDEVRVTRANADDVDRSRLREHNEPGTTTAAERGLRVQDVEVMDAAGLDETREPVEGFEDTEIDGHKVGRYIGVDPQFIQHADHTQAPLTAD